MVRAPLRQTQRERHIIIALSAGRVSKSKIVLLNLKKEIHFYTIL